ncbi:Uncharacterised protein [Vibrio cholerae]|nr:Uncharacterised protein [Vibrio cholerae]
MINTTTAVWPFLAITLQPPASLRLEMNSKFVASLFE